MFYDHSPWNNLFFSKCIFIFWCCSPYMYYFCLKIVQYNEYLGNTVASDHLALLIHIYIEIDKINTFYILAIQVPVRYIYRSWSLSSRWRLKLPASPLFAQPFVHEQIKENIKASHHWHLWGESTGDRWFPSQRASNGEYVSIWCRHLVLMWSLIGCISLLCSHYALLY